MDEAGNADPYAEVKATARVEGAAQLMAFGTGRCCTDENYDKGEITLYKGTAPAILRSDVDEGMVGVKSLTMRSAIAPKDETQCGGFVK